MDAQALTTYLTATFAGVATQEQMGYTFFFYGAERMLPFVTIATADNPGDDRSNLDRPGVFRVNIGIAKPSFQRLFGTAAIDTADYDYTALDVIMPHPNYAAQSYICVLNPGDATLARLEPLFAEAHGLAVRRAQRRGGSQESR